MSSPRQTLSHIQYLLKTHHLMPKAKMGQNFLIDLNLIDLIINNSELTKNDIVLEVGTGTGSLTAKLCDHAGQVITVELDPDFHRLAKSQLGIRPNLIMIQGDILEGKNRLHQDTIKTWQTCLNKIEPDDQIVPASDPLSNSVPMQPQAEKEIVASRKAKLIANLPYVVATPVIANLLLSEIIVDKMIVMVQLEVAERLVAQVGSKDYSALSVLVQSLADVQIIRRLPPSVFWPQPKVDSAIVKISANVEKRKKVNNPVSYREFLRDLYTHRRKNLRQAISAWPMVKLEKNQIDDQLNQINLSGTIRAETLTLEEHYKLFESFAPWIRSQKEG